MLIQKQGFWVSIASIALGLFTTLNTYQLNKYTQYSQAINQQLAIINDNINNLNDRVDNLYNYVSSDKKLKGEKS